FEGWYSDSACLSIYLFGQTITEDTAIYVLWQPVGVIVKYVYMYGGTENIINAHYDDILDLPELSREAFNFLGWYKEQTLVNKYQEGSPLNTFYLTLYAKWENKTFGVEIMPLTGGTIVVLSALPISYGGLLRYRVIPDTGYNVTSVTANSYTTPITQTGTIERSIADVRSAQTLGATFERYAVSVTVNTGLGGSATPNGAFSVLYGDSLSVMITPNVGYSIGTVRVNQISKTINNGVLTVQNITTAQTINIQFVISQHTVSINLSNATSSLTNNQTTVTYGSSVSVTISANENFYIESITQRGLSTGTATAHAVTNNQTATVVINSVTENTRIDVVMIGSVGTVSASALTGGSISPSGTISVNFSEELLFAITPGAGYQIADVKLNGMSLGKVSQYAYSPASSGGDTLVASFELIPFYIAASVTGNGIISASGVSMVRYGENLPYTITANANYHIDYLLIDGVRVELSGKTAEYTFINVTADHSIRAVFTIDTYSVSFIISGSGRMTLGTGSSAINITQSSSRTVEYGTPLYIYASNGNNIASLTVNGNTIDAGALSGGYVGLISENITISAVFALNSYSVTTSVVGSGNITAPANVLHGQGFLIEFSANAGNQFKKLLVSGTVVTPTGNSYQVSNVTGNVNVVIEFEIIILTISVVHGQGGSVNYLSTVNYGGAATITINAVSHYHIATLTTSSGNYAAAIGQNSYIIELLNVTQNFTCNIGFALDTFNISFNIGAGGSIRLTNGTTYTGNFVLTAEYGSDASYSIIANDGKEISGLIIDGVTCAISTSVEFTNISSAHTVSVQFASKMYQITAMPMSNGSVTLSASTITHGGSVTVTITPATGYALSQLKINGVTVSVSGNTYVITSITMNININATFVKL
ncbi:MAG: hypothetical protein EOM87_02725, partial [Clostridia bacterium]|nr:hypothetical protein [Clostridia bacterium]